MKLHLGCGQRYLEGYTNIDFPPTEHTVQTTSVADEFHNLFELTYKKKSIDEIRLHHVFEHFDRATACAFMTGWNSWLSIGGKLRIEVPDFELTFRKNFSTFKRAKNEGVALRHIFGSQEANWAVHYEGYSEKLLIKLFKAFGFKVINIEKIEYKKMHNIDITGEKIKDISIAEATEIADKYLSFYLVDNSDSEQLMQKVWVRNFINQAIKTVAKE